MSKIVVMGAGSWGTTIAILLAEKDNEIILWDFDSKKAEEINKIFVGFLAMSFFLGRRNRG